ncbi:MAG: HlyD family efflux transporter periplasmic adaptor subunit [Saprospiraceae bacterium]|nr:HlyD family efflux transporter periplasmic adaptor subunit [Saprospiraceae bacterium]
MKNPSKHSLWYAATLAIVFAACNRQETTVPERKNIEDAIFASGHIEQENNYTISAEVEGILLNLPVKEGDTVDRNDLIAVVEYDVQNNQLQDAQVVYEDAVKNASPNSPQLLNLRTQIEQAEKQLAFDKENYLRYKDLLEKKSVSQLDFEKTELQYKAAQSNLISLQKSYDEALNGLNLNVQRTAVQVNTQKTLLKDYKLFTETGGTVINVFKKQGELLRRGEAIATIGSGAYIIKLFVSEEDITKVDIGQAVAVNINTYPKNTFWAKVTKILPGFDENEQSYIVEAQFDQLPEKMFSGTQLQANIKNGSRENVLVIPTAYVIRGNRVLLENGEEKQITIGSKNSAWTEVVSGITEKDVIVKP